MRASTTRSLARCPTSAAAPAPAGRLTAACRARPRTAAVAAAPRPGMRSRDIARARCGGRVLGVDRRARLTLVSGCRRPPGGGRQPGVRRVKSPAATSRGSAPTGLADRRRDVSDDAGRGWTLTALARTALAQRVVPRPVAIVGQGAGGSRFQRPPSGRRTCAAAARLRRGTFSDGLGRGQVAVIIKAPATDQARSCDHRDGRSHGGCQRRGDRPSRPAGAIADTGPRARLGHPAAQCQPAGSATTTGSSPQLLRTRHDGPVSATDTTAPMSSPNGTTTAGRPAAPITIEPPAQPGSWMSVNTASPTRGPPAGQQRRAVVAVPLRRVGARSPSGRCCRSTWRRPSGAAHEPRGIAASTELGRSPGPDPGSPPVSNPGSPPPAARGAAADPGRVQVRRDVGTWYAMVPRYGIRQARHIRWARAPGSGRSRVRTGLDDHRDDHRRRRCWPSPTVHHAARDLLQLVTVAAAFAHRVLRRRGHRSATIPERHRPR